MEALGPRRAQKSIQLLKRNVGVAVSEAKTLDDENNGEGGEGGGRGGGEMGSLVGGEFCSLEETAGHHAAVGGEVSSEERRVAEQEPRKPCPATTAHAVAAGQRDG